MNKNKLLLSAALAGVIAAGAATPALAGDKEKCYGVAEAGKNDCASADGSHSCAGQAKTDKDANEWKYVEKGECEEMGGVLKPGANTCGDKDAKNSCEGKDARNGCEGKDAKNSCEGKDAKNGCEGKDAKNGCDH